MRPIKDDGTNAYIGDEGCVKLPVQKYEEPQLGGELCIQTVWELSDEEIEILLKTRRIYVSTVGDEIPPICLDVMPFVSQKEIIQ